ncbi:hypothetical protein DL96DRAFT_1601097 [Flagelloscypha sp. PMI_526]|nr:hypothetical protein DL96DRAFT_1601097 [Flagelloscypha sp. PMI_526]
MPCLRMPERPTLPSLHTLGLPAPAARRTIHENMDELNDIPSGIMNDYFTPKLPSYQHRARQASTSSRRSSQTGSSRSPSPQSAFTYPVSVSPPLPALPHAFSPYPSPPPPVSSTSTTMDRVRFVPSTIEEAQAMIIITPAGASDAQGRAVLVVGQTVEQIRNQPERSIAKGARVHPYRMVRTSYRRPV